VICLKAAYKVEGGKLVKVSVEAEQGKISGIRITGDFFLYPEEAISTLENNLLETELEESKLVEKIDSIVKGNSIQLFGFNAKDLAKTIMMAVEQ